MMTNENNFMVEYILCIINTRIKKYEINMKLTTKEL